MRIPDKITITISADHTPLKGMWVKLKFFMQQKNHHGLVFGPSAEDGRIEITRNQVKQEGLKTMELFLMDYADIEGFWTGRLEVIPMNRASLQGALSASRLFRSYVYPPGYQDSLTAADAALADIPEAELTATVQCETSESIAIETVRVRTS